MDYTLFIDESGNFKDRTREWIVSGVLVEGTPSKAEALVRNRIAAPLREVGVNSPKDAHLGPLRKQSMMRAHSAAKALFSGLASGAETIRVGAVRNREAVIVGTRKPLTGTFEQSYRLMVLDLLALLETSLPAGEPLNTLSLVVAERWRRGDSERMTSKGEMLADVIDQIPDSIEAGLASRGLLASTTRKSLDIQKAKNRWGLAAADFVANTVRNEKTDAALVETFAGPPLMWRTFTAFGTYEQRRARVAERDRDLPGALARWALLSASKKRERREQESSLARVWGDVLLDRDPYGPRAVLETVLERLRKDARDKPERLSAALQHLGHAIDAHDDPRRPPLLFRFRTFARAMAHVHGDVALGEEYAEQQREARAQMLQSPESLALVLDSDLAETTAHQYRLELREALESAKSYASLVEKYGEVWDLFDETGGAEAFAKSRLALRARSSLAHAKLLAGGLLGADLLRESADEFARLDPVVPHDVSRNRNNLMTALSKLGNHKEALALAREALSEPQPDEYDQFNALRAAANAALAKGTEYGGVREVYQKALALPHDGPGNPYHLTWREIGLLRHLDGDSSASAADAFKRAREKTRYLADSPIKAWLLGALEVHRAEASGHPTPIAKAFSKASATTVPLVEAAEKRAHADGALPAVRMISPY